MAAALGQTIMVVNKSGKVMGTSKHLVNVFKEAKSAYLEKKAEIKAGKEEDLQKKRAKKALAASVADEHYPCSPKSPHSRASSTSSRHSSRRHSGHSGHSHRRSDSDRADKRPPVERGHSDSHYAKDHRPRRTKTGPPSPLRFMEEAQYEGQGKEIARRHSYPDAHDAEQHAKHKRRSDGIDMDLAYGELPAALSSTRIDEEKELVTKVSALQRMLEEADCVQYSVSSMVKSLEDNPDAMAAVALTMAEISNLATKLGPGALMALKGAFPAVVAILLSPEFLIAAGVGVGLTVVSLAGYKIVKKIKAKKDMDNESQAEELEELDTDVSRIETWRRGIADAETASIATSVEGEYATPAAAAELRRQGRLPPLDPSKAKTKDDKKKKKKPSREDRKAQEKEAKAKKEADEKAEKAEKKKQKEQKALQEKLDKHAKKEQADQEKKRLEQKFLL